MEMKGDLHLYTAVFIVLRWNNETKTYSFSGKLHDGFRIGNRVWTMTVIEWAVNSLGICRLLGRFEPACHI